MKELQKLYTWFMTEWATVFVIGGVLALIFGDIKYLGWFIGGRIVGRFLFGKYAG